MARFGLRLLMILTALLGWAAVAAQPTWSADFCDTDTPVPSAPDAGFAGVFMPESPPASDPNSMWLTTGAGGFNSFTWDMGCDPISRQAASWDAQIANMLTGTGVSSTAATDAVTRWAFSPEWITTFLSDFASDIMAVLNDHLWIALIAAGLVFLAVTLAAKVIQGDVNAVAHGVGWAVLVVVIVGLAFAAPMVLPQAAQTFSGEVISDLQGGATDPATGQTEQVIRTVHYNSWLRRTFGSDESAAAVQHGKPIFDAVTFTYQEQMIAESSPTAYEALIEGHADQFREHADAVCEMDASACNYLHGRHGRMGLALLEVGFALVSNMFRIVVALLLVLACVLLAIYAVVWVVTAPFTVQRRGEAFGRGLIAKTATALGYTILAAVGSWGFGLWSEVALAPGRSAWMSLMLLALGTLIFWGLIRPDRKLLSLATGGRVSGVGQAARWIGRQGTHYFVSKHATDAALDAHAEHSGAPVAAPATGPAQATAPVVFASPGAAQSPVDGRPALGSAPVPAGPPALAAAPAMAVQPGITADAVDTNVDMRDAYRRPDPVPEPPDQSLIVMEWDENEGAYRRTDDEEASR